MEIESVLSISPVDIEDIIKEQAPHQWGFRGMTGDKANDLKYKVNIDPLETLGQLNNLCTFAGVYGCQHRR